MNFTSYHTNPLLFSPTITPFRIREFRVYKRRRFKSYPKLTLDNLPNPSPFKDLFRSLISQFPFPNSLHLLTPALGFASGVSLHLSKFANNSEFSDIGEWILFTSPTPFNRFVLLRCPSISFQGSELLENVNEKLVKEDRHFVNLNSGRIQVRSNGNGGDGEKLEYQRVCVGTDDGGVVSLDWPANLDLEEEHELDSTLLLVPGTAEGSMDRNVQYFVRQALKHGYFPVVMNPRGCAGSPLTTPRLFTAADSDDICTAIQFINKARPWTALMGVGWGYGASMLTKYLAEVGEKTPLTAATCIDNPFDLEEATRSSPYHIAVDQKLTGGLIDILRSNKELFQGRTKAFDVEKALSAKSVRDFERAISMVSYGFEAIQHFYAKSSTRGMVGNIKIPVLFIQNDDGTVPLFSIPRSSIAENPFTSLLLFSCLPSSAIASSKSGLSWCQHLTIEWLTAVELALLKGRHPLLRDVDLAINPSKGLALAKGIASDNSGKENNVSDLTRSSSLNGYSVEPIEEILEESDSAAGIHLISVRDSLRNLEVEDKQDVGNGGLQQNSSVDAELVREEEASSVDSERGQVVQTAQVVMNMLDVTMPGTLTEGKKKKVLTAVNQGETLMKALQDAVPEDVREKLTPVVLGILRAQGSKLDFERLLGIGGISNVSSGLRPRGQEKVGGISSAEELNKDLHSSYEMKRADDLVDGFDNNQLGIDNPAGGLESELRPSEKSQNSADIDQSQSTSLGSDTSNSSRKDTNEPGNNLGNNEFSLDQAAPYPDYGEKGSETDAKTNSLNWTEKATVNEERKVDEYKLNQVGGTSQLDSNEENNIQKNGEKIMDSSTDQSKMTPANLTEEALSPQGSSLEAQLMEGDGNDNQKRGNKNLQPVQDQNKSTISDSGPPTTDSNHPTFSVSQALDALTGMDDSTQTAVNSVFGVIETMISQLEEEKDDDSEVKDRKEDTDEKIDSEPKKQHIIDGHMLRNRGGNENDMSVPSDALSKPSVHIMPKNSRNSQFDARTGYIEEEPAQNSILYNGEGIDGSRESTTANYLSKRKNGKKDHLVGSKLLADNIDTPVNKIPLHIIASPYGGSLQNEYPRKYLVSKIPDGNSLDMDTTIALLLEYFPEEGQWKLQGQPGNLGDSMDDVTTRKGLDRKVQAYSSAKANDTDKIIEPLYVILDSDKQQEPTEKYEMVDNMNGKVEISNDKSEELMRFVNNTILESLKVEVGRRLTAAEMKGMESCIARDLEQVANAVSLVVGHTENIQCLEGKDLNVDYTSEKIGILQGEHIVRAISSAVQDSSFLRKTLPVGVIVGSSLAALRKYFDVTTVHDNSGREAAALGEAKKSGGENPGQFSVMETDQMPVDKSYQNTSLDSSIIREGEKTGLKAPSNGTVMIGAATAALGASALLVQQQDPFEGNQTAESSSVSLKKGSHQAGEKLEDTISDKIHNNVVTSLAEKAMSVASPVVPTKEDGEVDQERLVAMLADLGQKGGILRLVGKIALLWGGLRGAVSLTNRLILFLRIAERPLFQRILGFVSMVLVLWSPVAVPLLPTLVQSWATHNPSKFAELACIIGLYTAILILVMLWGKRIREYENPLEQYGLDFTSSPKIQNFLKGLIGGVLLVLSIHSANALLGCVSLSWPSSLPSSSFDAITWLKVNGRILILALQGILTATGVALVEELFFRSWLPEEIAADLGYHRGIIISGLAFSLFQRSPLAIPGLWLLSFGLEGTRHRSQGNLAIPIGLRAGILASSSVLQKGGFITYKNNVPIWLTGTHPFQPFSGAVGLAISLLLALILYPRHPLQRKEEIDQE